MPPQRPAIPYPIPKGVDETAAMESLRRFGYMVSDTAETASQAELDILDIRNRTDLLEGVVGYGSVTMSRNEQIGLITPARPRLQFGIQVGPMKGVSVAPNGEGLDLHDEGLWVLNVHTTAESTGFGGNNAVAMQIDVYDGNNALYRSRAFIANPGSDRGTVGGPFTFVAPGPNYKVRAWVESGRWRGFLGGTLFSMMTANKWDNRTNNAGPQTVPDGPGKS
jgi:hypothetical protein